MMYFIHYLKTYAATNKKGRELNEFISQFQDTLVYGDLSLDSLKQEVQTKVTELNAKYPGVKELVFNETDSQWSVKPKESADSYVFVISFSKVRNTYRFAEQLGMPQIMHFIESKGGRHE